MGANTSYRQGQTVSVAYTGTAASLIVPPNCTTVRLMASTDAFVTITSSAVATAATTAIGMPVIGGVYDYLKVSPGDVVSFIRSSVSGTGYITPMGD